MSMIKVLYLDLLLTSLNGLGNYYQKIKHIGK